MTDDDRVIHHLREALDSRLGAARELAERYKGYFCAWPAFRDLGLSYTEVAESYAEELAALDSLLAERDLLKAVYLAAAWKTRDVGPEPAVTLGDAVDAVAEFYERRHA